MATRHSKAGSAARKQSAKPYPDFPLFRHASGQWAKKCRGKLFYFGTDTDEALAKWQHDEPYRRAGKTPPPYEPDALTLRQLCNLYLAAKEAAVETGDLTKRSFQDYHRAAKQLLTHLGRNSAVAHLGPEDFRKLHGKLAAKYKSPSALKREIQMVRTICKFALDEQLIDRPVVFGQAFKGPSAKRLRIAKADAGPQIYSAAEYRRMIDQANPQLKAMLLLALNTGMGNADIALVKLSDLNLSDGWFRSFRIKTGIGRAAWLWLETREALSTWLDARDEWLRATRLNIAPDARELAFLTRHGRCWHRDGEVNYLSQAFKRNAKAASVTFRPGVNFYSCRRVVETAGGETGDQVAVDYVMGHVDPSQAAVYRQGISDERVRRVCEAVRAWLFPPHGKEG